MLKPEVVSDDQMTILARDIVRKIENELDYPGQIKVTARSNTRNSSLTWKQHSMCAMLFSYFINCFSKDTPKRFFGFAAVQRRIVWEVFFRISVTCCR